VDASAIGSGTAFSMRRTIASGLSGRLCHVFALLRLAVVPIVRTVIDLGRGIDPNLARTTSGGRGRRTRRWRGWSWCRRSRSGWVPQLCTPPWPRQAPLRVVPLKDEPSLHVAVTDAGVWANVASAKPEQAIREAAISRLFMGGISHFLSGGSTDDCVVDRRRSRRRPRESTIRFKGAGP
jgi:hypothetical protein